MFPIRLSIITYNLWNTMRWPLRQPALKQFIQLFCPDILCLQELHPETQAFLDEMMLHHDRVYDDFSGWIWQSNIYWNSHLLEEIEHGAEDIGIIDLLTDDRRLFWVRLLLRSRNQTVFVSTAHFSAKSLPAELQTGHSPRLEQAHRTVRALQYLVKSGEPAFFMGDLNDTSHPIYILHDAGYTTCFAALGLPPPPTAPCYPTADLSLGSPTLNQSLDWIVSNQYARAIAAQVPHFYHGDFGPSNHWPVLAIYEI